MTSRRDFLRSAAALSGGAFAKGSVPAAIARAFAIAPRAGTTFRDAEHVVVLMQENRSFDHAYGALRGVRGFRDPRVHRRPDGRPVWFQTDAHANTYAPFRLDIQHTNATWLGGLPHSWTDQIDARNGGRYDNWLIAKPKRDLPFTLGHYNRDDLPFYYALADAFTVCDQAFCASLTGTTANRLFLWTGNIRRDAADVARVDNADTRYDREASWTTVPERLEDAGVSWRVYQNEISLESGLVGEEDAWLANFTDNPLEWFTQYRVRFARSRRDYVASLLQHAPELIAAADQAAAEANLPAAEASRRRKAAADLRTRVTQAQAEVGPYDDAGWRALSARDQALHGRAFTTNADDADYRTLAAIGYDDGESSRSLKVPAGDVLSRFRRDVHGGELPAVSWLVAPENFSDHPSAPWYGAWYVSEVLDILTRNPAVWQKTILILCYDENDGYFDHVPPFTAPHPARPDTGVVSAGIDTAIDWANVRGRDHSIGLGYRVPLVIASPWSRGGAVNSQVFDHTSVLRLLETWLAAKGKALRETNISDWRRAVSGDLTSVFRAWDGEAVPVPTSLRRDDTLEQIYSARFRPQPDTPPLAAPHADTAAIAVAQEAGTRPSCPLPYDLQGNAAIEGGALVITLGAGKTAFGAASQGAPFNGYAYGDTFMSRAYGVAAGSEVSDRWPITGAYQLRVDGPNGFLRAFADGANATALAVRVTCHNGPSASADVTVDLANHGPRPLGITLEDHGYGAPPRRMTIAPGAMPALAVRTAASHGWYDFSVQAGELVYRYAGRVETGAWSISDPAMGGMAARR